MVRFYLQVNILMQMIYFPDYHFPMDELTGLTVVGKQRNGTALSHGLTLVPGLTSLTGNSLLFDGMNAVSFGNSHDECLGNLEMCPYGLTVAGWLKFGKKSSSKTLLHIISNGAWLRHDFGWRWHLKYKKLRFTARTSTTSWKRLTSPALPSEKWIHLMTSWHNSQGIKIYVNFEVVAKTTKTSTRHYRNLTKTLHWHVVLIQQTQQHGETSPLMNCRFGKEVSHQI